MQRYTIFVYCCQCSRCLERVFRSSEPTHPSWRSQQTSLTSTRCCMYSFWATDDERKPRLKHVEHW